MTSAHYDWVERVRILELENQRLMACQEETLKDTNRKLLLYLTELQTLRDKTERLTRENEELKRLCCYLDEDREHLRQSLTEWRDFGTEATSFMQNEVVQYKEKLEQLETRQNELLVENRLLEQLLGETPTGGEPCPQCKAACNHVMELSVEIPRDSGDGSSETGATDLLQDACAAISAPTDDVQHGNDCYEPKYQPSTRSKFSSLPRYLSHKRPVALDTATCFLECIRNLESRLRKLEDTKKQSCPQPHVMQTSMSAPDLEIVCQSSNDDLISLSEEPSKVTLFEKKEATVSQYRRWNSSGIKDAVVSVDGRTCNAA